eukprot:TRINITY_DN293_c0_g1_i1.p2 TRINITY_DN293_c0_g1~~TRINITY_DN293_c0_g1_i1.p2  ORF type:complete len:341 (+),score=49.81 TRINITY_DN293_c0_g1_i1:58-1080(+)
MATLSSSTPTPSHPTTTSPWTRGARTLTDEQEVVWGVWMAGSFISLLSAGLVIAIILFFSRNQLRSSRLVLAIASATFLESVSALLSWITFEFESPLMCRFQGALTQFSQLSMFAWTFIISLDLYLHVVKGVSVSRSHELIYHSFSWGFSLLFTILPLSTDAYGPTGVWCWIRSDERGQVWRWIVFYLPLYGVIMGTIFLYSLVIRTVRTRVQSKAESIIPRLNFYPLVLLILLVLYVFPTIVRINDGSTGDWTDSFFLWILHALTAPLLGVTSAFIYGVDRPVRLIVVAQLNKWHLCCCCSPNDCVEEFLFDCDSDVTECNFESERTEEAVFTWGLTRF